MQNKNKSAKSAKGMGSIRQRTVTRNGSCYTYYEGRCTVGYDEMTGKQIQRSVTGKTQKVVTQRMNNIITEVNKGEYIKPDKQTLEDWLKYWLDNCVEHSVKPYTLDSYRTQCEKHITPALGRTKISALSALQIQRFYNSLQAEGLSPKTIKNIHGVLHRALNQAVRLGIIRSNPSEACELPKVYKKDIVPLEHDDIKALLKALEGNKFELLIRTTLFTGLRQGEVLGLTWECVDFETNTIYINKQLSKTQKTGGEYQLVPTKSGKSRVITVAPAVIEDLKMQKRLQDEMRINVGDDWKNENNLVFTNETGGHLTHMTVYKYYKKAAKLIGRDNSRFHDLRHTYAVAAIESGDDIKTVQGNLGHATASFTLDVYGHVSQKMRHQSAEHMESFIQSVSGEKRE